MNNTKTYTLKKEIHTPNTYILAGTQFSQSIVDGAYISSNGRCTYSPSIVENNSEWFLLKEEVKEPLLEDQFLWYELYPSPTEKEVGSIEFKAVWGAIKGWDLQRQKGAGYSGANGSDVIHILKALSNIKKEEVPKQNELTKEKLQKIFEVKSDSTQGTLTPQNWKNAQVPSQQKEFTEPRGNSFGFDKEYEILTYINPNTVSDIIGYDIENSKNYAVLKGYPIRSVKRLSDNTIWTVRDMVSIGGYKEWEIVELNESLGVVYADLKWSYNDSISGTQTVLQNLQKI